jgi:hypothetical protein
MHLRTHVRFSYIQLFLFSSAGPDVSECPITTTICTAGQTCTLSMASNDLCALGVSNKDKGWLKIEDSVGGCSRTDGGSSGPVNATNSGLTYSFPSSMIATMPGGNYVLCWCSHVDSDKCSFRSDYTLKIRNLYFRRT